MPDGVCLSRSSSIDAVKAACSRRRDTAIDRSKEGGKLRDYAYVGSLLGLTRARVSQIVEVRFHLVHVCERLFKQFSDNKHSAGAGRTESLDLPTIGMRRADPFGRTWNLQPFQSCSGSSEGYGPVDRDRYTLALCDCESKARRNALVVERRERRTSSTETSHNSTSRSTRESSTSCRQRSEHALSTSPLSTARE